ncbi:MAG: hypothetical protein ACRDSH_13685 [Pseudonocardiaceae bacterium]
MNAPWATHRALDLLEAGLRHQASAGHPDPGLRFWKGLLMTQNKIIGLPAERPIRDALILKIGGVCTIVGAIAFGTLRVLHGDTPGADPRASLAFVATRPIYAGVHIGAVFAALLTLAGLIALASSLTRPGAWMLGRLGVASSLVGMAIFGVESTSEGLALPELAHASANAPADQQAELARAAQAVLAVTHGPSLVAIALLYGISLVLFGLAVVLDDYPSWLGWAGIVVGGATLAAATGQYLQPDLMPGFLIYGVLASILAQLWLISLAVVMLRRARSAPGT